MKTLIREGRRLITRFVPKRHRAALQRRYRPLIARAYQGDGVECPCCGGTFRAFMPKWNVTSWAPGARCPRCGSLPRHRLLVLFLQRESGLLDRPAAVLHFAAEPGIEDTLRDAPNLDYVTADLEAPPAMIAMDVTKIPFEDGRWDLVVCNHVLEHVPDDRAAMREIRRVLKTDGRAILNVPFDPDRETSFEDPTVVSARERERLFGQEDHVRLYGRDYLTRLESAGFSVSVRRYADELGDAEVARYALPRDEPLIVCTPV